ncbi:uncharacterized protein MONOS_17778 [Monocercomonoides exilis]|uniref:uncharacterized protein n=1 Tax=Monocercomonoides exilis TaxID=2049356 RepID=UPI003559F227|nr:hypothetical protein MONOS_17778 [Monocercomonoides exilis]
MFHDEACHSTCYKNKIDIFGITKECIWTENAKEMIALSDSNLKRKQAQNKNNGKSQMNWMRFIQSSENGLF